MSVNLGSLNSYRRNVSGLSQSTKQLSTGYRINSAADDASGLAVSEGMRTQIAQNQTAVQNTRMQVSSLQTADGALSSVHNALGRMRELAFLSSSGVYTDSDRNILQNEFTQLQEQVSNVYKSTRFNGQQILSDAPDLSGLSITSQGSAVDAVERLASAINTVSDQRGTFGAQQNGAEHQINNLTNSIINTQDSESEIRDLDIALAVMENTRKQILSQSSLFMRAQANQSAYSVMRFFQ